jgi:hypothetical protein
VLPHSAAIGTCAARLTARARLGLVLLPIILLAAAACNDSPTRTLAAAPPDHVDSLHRDPLAASRRSSLLQLFLSCDPVTGCPGVLSAEPRFFTGYDQPGPIRINLVGPARQIVVTGQGHISCSGTFGTLTGYDSSGTALGSVDLELTYPPDCSEIGPADDVTFGAQAGLETKEVMAYAILTPMSILEYSIFGYPDHAAQRWDIMAGSGTPHTMHVEIVRAEGVNEQGSFTYAPDERKIALEARVTPADPQARVTWEVVDAPGDNVVAIPPAVAPTGLSTTFKLPRHDSSRWPTDHPGAADRKPLRYQVTAVATKGWETRRSEPVIVEQDLVDTIREEYFEFGLTSLPRHIPRRQEFSSSPPVKVGANNGDYELAVLEPKFIAKLEVLKNSWNGRWQLNTIYRNPVHNLNGHIRSRSKPSLVSWHMWGCAADLQTFPQDGSAKQYKFWHELDALARKQGWDTESLEQAKVGHVHVELDCP